MISLQTLIQEYIEVVKLNEEWLKEEILTCSTTNPDPVKQLGELLQRTRYQKKKIQEMLLNLEHFNKLCNSLNVDPKNILVDEVK